MLNYVLAPRRGFVLSKGFAFAALVLGASAIAFAPIFVRLSDVSPTASAFWRMALSVPVLWLWVWVEERGNRVAAPREWKLLILAGLFFAADLAVLHFSILQTSVANSQLELNLAPIYVALGTWLIFRQRISGLFLVALVLAMSGAVIVIGPHFDGAEAVLAGDGFGLLAGLFYACYMLAIKAASSTVSTARIMAVNTTAAAIALLPYMLATAPRVLPRGGEGWLILVGLALIPHVLGQSLVAFGFSRLPASFSSLSLLLQPVMAAIYAWVLLSEAMSPMQIAGGGVVLLGIYLAKRTT